MRFTEYSLNEASAGYGIPQDPYEINNLYVRGDYTITWKTIGSGVFSLNLHEVQQAVFAELTPYHIITVKVNGETVKSDTSRLIETKDFASHIKLSEDATIQLIFSGSDDALTLIGRMNSFITSDDGSVATTTVAPSTTEEPVDTSSEEWVRENGVFVTAVKYDNGCGRYELFLDDSSSGYFAFLDDRTLWFVGNKHIAGKYTAKIVVRNASATKYEYVDFEIIDCSLSTAPCSDGYVDDDIPTPNKASLVAVGCIEGFPVWRVTFDQSDYLVDVLWSYSSGATQNTQLYRLSALDTASFVDGYYWHYASYTKEPFTFYVSYRFRDRVTGYVGEWSPPARGASASVLCGQLPNLPEFPENPPTTPFTPDCPPDDNPPPPDPGDPDGPGGPDGPSPPNSPNPNPAPCVGIGCGDGGGSPGGPNDPTCCNPPPGWPGGPGNPPPPGGCVGTGCGPGSEPGGPGGPPGSPGGPGPGDGSPPGLPPRPIPPQICPNGPEKLSFTLEPLDVNGLEWQEGDRVTAYFSLVEEGENETCDEAFEILGLNPESWTVELSLGYGDPVTSIDLGTGCSECIDWCIKYTGTNNSFVAVNYGLYATRTNTDEDGNITIETETVVEGTQRSLPNCDLGCDDPATLFGFLKIPDYDYTDDGIQYRYESTLTPSISSAYNIASEYVAFTKQPGSDVYVLYTNQSRQTTGQTAIRRRESYKLVKCERNKFVDVTAEYVGCEVMYWATYNRVIFPVGNRYQNFDQFWNMSYWNHEYSIQPLDGNNNPNLSLEDAPDYDANIEPLCGGWALNVPHCVTCCDQDLLSFKNQPRQGDKGININNNGGFATANNLSCYGTDVPDPNWYGSTVSIAGANAPSSLLSMVTPCSEAGATRLVMTDNRAGSGRTWVYERGFSAYNPREWDDRNVVVEDTNANNNVEGCSNIACPPGKSNHKSLAFINTGEGFLALADTRPANDTCGFGGNANYTLQPTWPNGIQRDLQGATSTESIDWNVINQQWTPSPSNTCWGVTSKDGAWTYTYEVVDFWNENASGGGNPLP